MQAAAIHGRRKSIVLLSEGIDVNLDGTDDTLREVRDQIRNLSATANRVGATLYALDPRSGRVVHQQRVYGPYGENGFPIENREVVGGMSIGTLLTIFVVPTVYTLLARKQVPGEILTAELAQAGAD